MKVRRFAVYLVVLIGLTAFACSSGSKSYQQYKEFASIVNQGESVYKQYKTADYVTAKTSLLNYIAALEELLRKDHPEEFTLEADILVSYVRLAKLEESNKGTDKELYMKKAEEQCRKPKIKQDDCSSAKLRELVDLMDKVAAK